MTPLPFIPAHSASLRAFTPVFDGLWTRVNALLLGIQGQGLGLRNGVPATHSVSQTRVNALLLSRGAPRGDERMLHGFHATRTRRASPAEPMWRHALSPARGLRYEARAHRPAAGLLMFPKPKPALTPNTYAYESEPLVKPTGFREYDARWLLEKEINLMGVQALGLGLGTLIHELGVAPKVVTGHDFRAYSASVKTALVSGLMAAGCNVHDIGLALTPMAYFAQFDLDVPCVAMVTASHNDNGWTGVKMGAARPLTFGPDEMSRLKAIVLEARFDLRGGGAYAFVENFPARYIADLTQRAKLKRRLKVVCACGNGTAGAFAPQVLAAVGCEVVPLDCELDHTFLKYNPNTEDLKMLHAMRDEVLRVKADVALGFDGDGDRCGVVDNEGEEIFADKVGVMLARDISAQHKGATFVADVKSTGLFMTDPT